MPRSRPCLWRQSRPRGWGLIVAAYSLCATLALPAGADERRPQATTAVRDQTPGPLAARLERHQRLAKVAEWGIQLRRIDAAEIARSSLDLVVVDYAPYRHLTFEFPFSPADVAAMQKKPDGGRRIVLAYLSIGEAEDYRYYWRREWNEARTSPRWLGPENKAWPGNFPVRFWDSAWQRILYSGTASYLDRILASGFDGIYLDRADVYQEWQSEKRDSERAMVGLLGGLCARARVQRPDFLIVLQNAEELLARPEINAAIDGFAKEDLYFGATKDGEPNAPAMVETSLSLLKRAQKSGVATLVLEYPRKPEHASAVRARAARDGVLLHLAERSLTRLTLGPASLPFREQR